jgi:hypothetical protein
MVTFQTISENVVHVFVEKKHVGQIHAVLGGWAYEPKGATKHRGETFTTLKACKLSVAGDD